MAYKRSSTAGLTFTLKKDFGLGQHRLALPPEELENPSETQAQHNAMMGKMPSEKKQRRKSGMFSLRSSRSSERYGGRMTRLMQIDYETQKRSRKVSRGKSAPSSPSLPGRQAGGHTPSSSRPSPSLHSRMVKKQLLDSDGEKRGSLETLKQLYGYDNKPQNIDTGNLIRLTVTSKGENERQVTLRKSRDGLGMHLSAGPPPIYVQFTDRGGEAAAAGVKVGDEILEVNGHVCKTMQLTELMQLKSLLQHVAATSGKQSNAEVEVTVTSVDSDVASEGEDERDGEVAEISESAWQRIKMEQKKINKTELPVNASPDTREQRVKSSRTAEKSAVTRSAKVELGDKEWEKMKEKQELIFNTTASSSMIVSPTPVDNKKLAPPTASKDQPSPSKKKKFSIFSRKGAKESRQEKPTEERKAKASSSAKDSKTHSPQREVAVKLVSKKKTNQETTEEDEMKFELNITRSPTADQLASSNSKKVSLPQAKSAEPIAAAITQVGAKQKSDVSKGLFAKSKHKTDRKGTDSGENDIFAIPVTGPMLGVKEGRSKRDVTLVRAETKRRRPTNPSAMLAAREEALMTKKRTESESLQNSADLERENKTSKPDMLMTQSSYIPRPQSASLSKKEKQQIKRLISEQPSSASKTQNRSSAAMVAQAAALKKQKSQELEDELKAASSDNNLSDTPHHEKPLKLSYQGEGFEANSQLAAAIKGRLAGGEESMEGDTRSLRRRKSVEMPVKVLTLERKHKGRKSSDSDQPESPTSESEDKKLDAPSWIAVAKNKQMRSDKLYNAEKLSSKKTEPGSEVSNPDKDGSQSQPAVAQQTNESKNSVERTSVKNRMAMFEKK